MGGCSARTAGRAVLRIGEMSRREQTARLRGGGRANLRPQVGGVLSGRGGAGLWGFRFEELIGVFGCFGRKDNNLGDSWLTLVDLPSVGVRSTCVCFGLLPRAP